MAAPIAVTIGGVSRPTTIQDNFSITSVQGQTVSTLNGTIADKSAVITVPEGVDLIVTRPDTGERIFGGLTSFVTGYTDGFSRYWDIMGQSYTILLDRTLFFASYAPGFTYDGLFGDKAVLAHLFEKSVVGAGGQTGAASEINARSYVQQGAKYLSSLVFKYQYAREAAQLLGAYTGYSYYVDFDLNLHYYLKESIPAPYSLSSTPGETLGGLTAVGYRGLKYKRDATRVINNYVVFGANLYSNIQYDTVANNGVSLVLYIGLRGSAIPIAAPPGQRTILVWVNTGSDVTPIWTSKTVGIKNIDNPATYDCLVDAVNQTLTFTIAPPNLTKSIKIEYVFVYGAGVAQANAGSIAKYGRTLSQRLVAADANSAVNMQANMNNLSTQFSYALEVLTCSLDDSAFPAGTSRFKVGQYVPFKNAVLGINKSYWIHSITTKILGGAVRSYDLELRNWSMT